METIRITIIFLGYLSHKQYIRDYASYEPNGDQQCDYPDCNVALECSDACDKTAVNIKYKLTRE